MRCWRNWNHLVATGPKIAVFTSVRSLILKSRLCDEAQWNQGAWITAAIQGHSPCTDYIMLSETTALDALLC